MVNFTLPTGLGFSILPPQTVNVGASFGPRVSTAGFQSGGWGLSINLRLYADLDGNEWQEDGDIVRRGAQAVVPFAKRAAKALEEGRGRVVTAAEPRRPGRFETAVEFRDVVEGFERRLIFTLYFRASETDDLRSIEARLVSQTVEETRKLGTAIHGAVNDSANSHIFQPPRKSA